MPLSSFHDASHRDEALLGATFLYILFSLMLLQRNQQWFENVFFLTIITFLLCKLFGWPTLYPAIGIATWLLHKRPIEVLKNKKYFLYLWLGLLIYNFAFLPEVSHSLVATSFFITPLYALSLVCLQERFKFSQKYFVTGMFYFSIFFLLMLAVGLALHAQEIYQHLSWALVLSELRRTDFILRNILFSSFIPWAEQSEANWALVSLLGTLLVIFSMLSSLNRRGKVTLGLLFLLNFIAMSRLYILAALAFVVINAFAQSKKQARVMMGLFLLIPVIVLNLEARLLNGRIPVWEQLIKNFNWHGNGLGSARAATIVASTNIGQKPIIQYPHNIHIEIIYDWGWIVYALLALVSLYYCFKHTKVRLAFAILFVLFFNYSIYSPWASWLLLFAHIADKNKFET